MGFLNEFAYGFANTAKPILEAQDKYQAEADARIREKVAAVQPEAELYQRQQDILAAEKQKQVSQDISNFSAAMNGTGIPTAAQTPTDNSASPFPQSTVTTPGTGSTMNPNQPSATPGTGSTMNPNQPSATPGQPFMPTPDDHYDAINKATTGKAIADLSGNKGLAAAYDTQIKLHQNELERGKQISAINKDTLTSADGIVVPEDISKAVEKKIIPGQTSIYNSGKLQKVLSDSDENGSLSAGTEQDIAKNIHVPLTASYMAANPHSKEVSSVIEDKTLKATQAIVIINSADPSLTQEDKMKAVMDLQKYMQATYKNVSGQQLDKDTNLQHVITPALLDKINSIGSGTNPSSPVQSASTPQSVTPQVMTDADYNNIQPGQTYKDPQGNIRTKPQAQ